MKKYLFIAAALYAAQARAVTPIQGANIPSISMGSMGNTPGPLVVSSDDTSYFQLYTWTATNGGNTVCPFMRQTIAAGVTTVAKYQVPAGQTLYCKTMSASASSAGIYYQLVSSTATFNCGDAVGALTGPKYQANNSSTYPNQTSETNYKPAIEAIDYKFEASTFPGVQTSTNASYYFIKLWCKLKAN